MLRKEGIIPVLLGTLVSLGSFPFLKSKKYNSLTNIIFGFGLAHIVLGVIDLFEHDKNEW